MLLNHSQNRFHILFEITEERQVALKYLSCQPPKNEARDMSQSQIADVHVSGENPADHHFFKHTASSRGRSLAYVSHREEPRQDGSELEILLADETMQVTVHYRFYHGISCVRSWTVVKNISENPIGLEYVSSFTYTGIDDGELPVSEQLRVYLPHNAWQREVNWKSYSLSDLGYERVSDFSGKRICLTNNGTFSTKEYLPMGAVENTETENTLLWQIENNGAWHWELSDVAGKMYLKLSGPTEQENHWHRELKSGESFESVKVCVALGENFDAALAEMTAYRRKIALKKGADSKLPVIFNDYMNCLWADPTEEKMIPVIDKAAETGAEYYCMDAGWYAEGTWWDSVGEWQPCARRFPNGIRHVLDYVRSKGMIPGMWLELEVMGIHCPLAKTLDDKCFFMRHGKRVIDNGRYFLDFRNQWVRDYATSVIDRLVTEYGVGYIKNDYNVDGGIGTEINADSVGDGLLQHNRAYLSWLREIKQKYPSLIWENCSSGGMRMEYAMLSVADLQSVSDQSNYRFNAPIAAASATAVLPEQAAIWSYPMETDDENAVVLNMVNALLSRIHLSGAVTSLSESNFARVKEAVALYKQLRQDIPSAVPFYPLGIPQYTDGWLCAAYRCETCIRMAVWRMASDTDHLSIPVEGKARILYPSKSDAGKVCSDSSGLTVFLKERYSAMLIEVDPTR